MRRALALATLALLPLAACHGTDRPEGVVERWLISLNQGKAGQPEKYAVARVTNEVLPNWRQCDTGSLDVIEVGAHATGTEGYPAQVLVPYRIKYVSDLSSCHASTQPRAPLRGAAVVLRRHGDWRIVGVERSANLSYLRVPSQGGKAIGSAPLASWLLALAASVGLMLLVALLIHLTPKPAPLPTTGDPQRRRPGTSPGPLV